MESLTINIKSSRSLEQKVLIEMDVKKFERLAANLGFFSSEFLESLSQAEKDYKSGRVRKIKSLKELRK